MTIRLYLIPVNHIPLSGGGNYNTPAYLPHRFDPAIPGLEGIRWAWTTYLLEDIGLIVADTDDTQHALLNAQAGVLAVPALDTTIANTTARNRVRTILEAANVPGSWVNTGMSYRSVIRVVLGMWQFHGRLTAIANRRIFDGSISLDMTISQIPAAVRDRLQQAADGLGLDYSAVTGATTIRQLLKGMGDQFAAHEFHISGAGLEVVI